MQAFAESQLLTTLPSSSGAPGSAASRKLAERLEEMAARAFSYFDASQIKEDVPLRERFYRTVSKGGWPFSTNGARARVREWTPRVCLLPGHLAARSVSHSPHTVPRRRCRLLSPPQTTAGPSRTARPRASRRRWP
jgi:hypothetical protein